MCGIHIGGYIQMVEAVVVMLIAGSVAGEVFFWVWFWCMMMDYVVECVAGVVWVGYGCVWAEVSMVLLVLQVVKFLQYVTLLSCCLSMVYPEPKTEHNGGWLGLWVANTLVEITLLLIVDVAVGGWVGYLWLMQIHTMVTHTPLWMWVRCCGWWWQWIKSSLAA